MCVAVLFNYILYTNEDRNISPPIKFHLQKERKKYLPNNVKLYKFFNTDFLNITVLFWMLIYSILHTETKLFCKKAKKGNFF